MKKKTYLVLDSETATLDFADELAAGDAEKKKKITIENILETCAKYFCVEKEDILSSARAKEIVNARKYAIYLSRELLDLSYPLLAQEFKKNHTTIMYQHEKLKKDISQNKAMKIITDELSQLIQK